MSHADDATMDTAVRSAVALRAVESAAIFVVAPGGSELELAAAAGIVGPALEGLKAAVRKPSHPIARTVVEGASTYDVPPMNPGGPRLRSHLPLVGPDGNVIGVLAVAHEDALDADARASLNGIAEVAAASVK